MKTYIVTGGCGFIGSHMVDKLISLGHRVFVIDNLSARSNEFFYKNESANATYYHSVDITDFDKLFQIFEMVFSTDNGVIDAVFHFAAEARIQPMIKNPKMAIDANTIGTVNVLEACRRLNIRRMVHSSTSSVYGNGHTMPLLETAVRNPLNPYSISKASAEDFCKMYHSLWGVDVVILRYFNVFGERQPIKGTYAPVVGKFLRQYENGEALTVVGDGSQRRDFTWVGDIVEANYIAAMSNYEVGGEVFNVGTGENVSVLELAKGISEDIEFVPSRPGEAKETLADSTKIKSIGWKPTKNIEGWVKENIGQKKFSVSEKIY
jgi:UDP-glucose 4-epimerase